MVLDATFNIMSAIAWLSYILADKHPCIYHEMVLDTTPILLKENVLKPQRIMPVSGVDYLTKHHIFLIQTNSTKATA
jgi:hypothetical protein